MKLLDKNRFASAFQTMCEIFDKKNTKIMLAGYFKTLESFSIDQVEKAVSTAIGSCKFFPKPVELIEFITGGQSQIASNAQIEVDKILCHFQTIRFDQTPGTIRSDIKTSNVKPLGIRELGKFDFGI